MPLNSCAIWSNSKEVCFTWDVRVGVNLRHCTRTRTWGLVEGHADPVLLAPDDVTGNVRAVRLKNKVETLGDVVGLGNLERRPRNGHVADQAINQAAGELNRSRHQYGVARDCASFHET